MYTDVHRCEMAFAACYIKNIVVTYLRLVRLVMFTGIIWYIRRWRQADKVMTAIFLEGGIVFHSIFVGINYGILEDDGTSTALLIALIFHQAGHASDTGIA